MYAYFDYFDQHLKIIDVHVVLDEADSRNPFLGMCYLLV